MNKSKEISACKKEFKATTKINNIYTNWILSNPSEWWLWGHEKWKQKNEE